MPKEVVELSYTTGQDIASLQTSYDNLIHEFYDQLRDRRLEYLNDTWTPHFIEKWIADGKLVEVAKGELVWSEEDEEFRAPTSGNAEQELLATVLTWADEAMFDIQQKRDSLLFPLDREESKLRREVREAFARIVQANATITAHLNSLRKVQEVQDDVLSALNVKELRDKIDDALVSASERANKALRQVKEADSRVSKIQEELQGEEQ